MPSTYSSSLRLELQATGENANTWGTKTNNNLELIEQAIAGYVKITLTSASATYPLVIADASASDGRNAYIEFVGTVASAISITVPDVEKGYWVKNSATGSPLTFRTSSGTGVVLPTNQWVNLVSDGASITSTFPTSITGYALLSATQTFTGANTFTSVVNVQSNLSVTGNAFVSGVTTLASAVDIKGATSLASTLVANGNATFNSNVSVSGVMVVGAGAVGAPSYSTTGDTNTGIYFPAADTIAVATSGTERMRIDNAGNVGIATTSPSSFGKFAVQGASNTRAFYADALAQPVARYDDNSFVSNGLTIRNTGVAGSNQGIGLLFQLGAGGTAVDSGAIQMRSEADYSTAANQDAAMLFFTVANGTNSERMRIDSSGNVGIGTTSPTTLLNVSNANGSHKLDITAGAYSYIESNGPAGSELRGFVGGVQYSNIRTRSDSMLINNIGNTATIFNTNNTERMRIISSGDVGIGTSSPGAKLEVAGTLTATGNTINFGGNDATNTIMNVGGVPTGNKYAITDYIGDSTYTDFGLRVGRVNDGANGTSLLQHRGTGPMILDVFDAGYLVAKTNSTERMRIDSSGNVGIGTSSPSYRLQTLRSAGTLSPSALTRGAVLATTYTRSDNSDFVGRQIGIGVTEYASFIQAEDTSLNVAFLALNPNGGNVGIGTSSPANRLHVKGAWTTNEGQFQIDADSGQQFSGMTFQNNGTYKFIMYNDNTNSWTFLSTASGSNQPLLFGTNETERMRIDSSGNVGINVVPTANTTTKLFIEGDLTRVGASGGFLLNLYYDTVQARWEYAGTGTGAGWIDSGSGNYTFQSTGSTSGTAGAAATALAERMRITGAGSVVAGGSVALSTTATDGFLYVPTCAGTPTGTPTAITGMAPIVVNTTNNKLYFYSGGAWRDAGP